MGNIIWTLKQNGVHDSDERNYHTPRHREPRPNSTNMRLCCSTATTKTGRDGATRPQTNVGSTTPTVIMDFAIRTYQLVWGKLCGTFRRYQKNQFERSLLRIPNDNIHSCQHYYDRHCQ